jgi:hypothetical protein
VSPWGWTGGRGVWGGMGGSSQFPWFLQSLRCVISDSDLRGMGHVYFIFLHRFHAFAQPGVWGFRASNEFTSHLNLPLCPPGVGNCKSMRFLHHAAWAGVLQQFSVMHTAYQYCRLTYLQHPASDHSNKLR